MEYKESATIAELRVLVGYLGEQSQFAWWQSAFFSASSRAFLAPVFSKTAFIAQCQGVKEAAGRAHDEYIGIGNVYHLFRLPEGMEQALHQVLHRQDVVAQLLEKVKDRATAEGCLADLGSDASGAGEGPVRLGDITALRKRATWQMAAACYSWAFQNKLKAYPYFSGEK